MRKERFAIIRNTEDSISLAVSPGKIHHVWVLSGTATFVRENQSAVRLSRGETAEFAGDAEIQCLGLFEACVLTADPGSKVFMDRLEIVKDNTVYPTEDTFGYADFSQIFYVDKGYAVISPVNGTVMLEEGQEYYCSDAPELQKQTGIMGEGIIIRLQILSGKGEEAIAAKEKRAKEKKPAPTVKDFCLCVLLSLTNFRLADRLSPFKKKNWPDEEITDVLHKIRRGHISVIAWIVALCVILAVGMSVTGFTFLALVLSVLGWSIVQICLVMPVVYTIMMPRPISEHVKPVSSLTEEELELRQEQLEEVRRKKRALKRY